MGMPQRLLVAVWENVDWTGDEGSPMRVCFWSWRINHKADWKTRHSNAIEDYCLEGQPLFLVSKSDSATKNKLSSCLKWKRVRRTHVSRKKLSTWLKSQKGQIGETINNLKPNNSSDWNDNEMPLIWYILNLGVYYDNLPTRFKVMFGRFPLLNYIWSEVYIGRYSLLRLNPKNANIVWP